LVIYLRATTPTLVHQIQKRGREYENTIRIDYLEQLNQRYEAWFSRYSTSKKVIINVDNNNFADNPDDLNKVITTIDAQINGLF
jgi:deoxyadenosine/deoxycytidine kinase